MTTAFDQVLDWITRDYESHTFWTDFAREAYLLSNGDADYARMVVADALRRHVSSLSEDPIEVRRWSEGFSSIDTILVEPPPTKTISDPSVNWLRVADYVLMAGGSPWDEFEAENQRRKEISAALKKSYDLRQVTMTVADYLQAHPKEQDNDIISALQKEGLEANKARINDAKKYLKMSTQEQQAWRRETEPPQLKNLPLYKTVYQ